MTQSTESEPTYPYQDSGLSPEQRAEDLLSRMSVEDKAALLFIPFTAIGSLDQEGLMGAPPARELLKQGISHAAVMQASSAGVLAEWYNALQAEALKRPLGVPFTIATDPRHAFANNPGTAMVAGPFSQWPEPLGFGAIGDADLVERFADTVRREYVAVGLRTALHPQIDIASDPRWARGNATFGADADLVARLGVAYVKGLQGEAVGPESVIAMAKHFPGGGPQKDGEDPHLPYGKDQVYPGDRFEEHLKPFRELIAAGVGQLMPYYGKPVGLEIGGEAIEEVGFGFNKKLIDDLLRGELGFEGIVCTDWGILTNIYWGVEDLSYEERMIKSFDAGVDQFGGENSPELLADLVKRGVFSEERIDVSARRVLREKFRLGLFDNPFVDVEQADVIVGTPEARAEGRDAQSAAQTLLVNGDGPARLPLRRGIKVYAEGIGAGALDGWAEQVAAPEEADVAILRMVAPWEQRGKAGDVEFFFHAGSLDFAEEEVERIRGIAAKVPTVVDVYLDRPAILAPLVGAVPTLIANFGSSDDAFLRVVFGVAEPRGALPFEIPSSMAAVEASREDVPNDTVDPTFALGFGLRYESWTPSEAPTQDEVAAAADRREELPFVVKVDSTTLGQLLDHERSRDLIDSYLPDLKNHQLLEMVKTMPFTAVLDLVRDDVAPEKLDELARELERA